MRLSTIAVVQAAVDLDRIAADVPLAIDVQASLFNFGLLDGPPDGDFGPVSHWALHEFIGMRMPQAKRLDAPLAKALVEAVPLPVVSGNDLAGPIAKRMLALGYVLVRHPDCVNIVYLEGVDVDGRANGNKPNAFNDVRAVLRFDAAGVPSVTTWLATTEPGRTFTNIPENVLGAARIAFNDFKAWRVGDHPGMPKNLALIQRADIAVHRDLNKDFQREGDFVDVGQHGINQHWGYDYSEDDIRDASAGCLVGRTTKGHREFMAMVKGDPRFLASSSFMFRTAVLDGTLLDG